MKTSNKRQLLVYQYSISPVGQVGASCVDAASGAACPVASGAEPRAVTSAFPTRALADPATIVARLEAEEGATIEAVETYFDPARHAFMLLARITSGPSAGYELHVDEASGRIVEWRYPFDLNGNVNVSNGRFDYPIGTPASESPYICSGGELFTPATPSVLTQNTVFCAAAAGSSCWTGAGTCQYTLARWSGIGGIAEPDYPQISTLETGNGQGLGAPVQRIAPCSGIDGNGNPTVAGWTSPWSGVTEPAYELYGKNAHRVFSRLADIKRHWTSFYPAGLGGAVMSAVIQSPTLWVPDGAGGLKVSAATGTFDPVAFKIRIRHDPSNGYIGGEYMFTMAHEYQHYVHRILGGAPTMGALKEVKEGFADTGPLRYMVHESVTGAWPTLSYFSTHGDESLVDRPHRHVGPVIGGGRLPRPRTGRGGEANAALTYPNEYCVDEIAPNACGAVIGLTYWELATDFCRLTYMGCNAPTWNGSQWVGGDRIIQSGPYQYWAWALTNSAYGFAAQMTVDGDDVLDFMDDVAARYAQFQEVHGFLDAASLDRVTSVLEHHCVGPSRCAGHKFPGSLLPSAETAKVGFYEGEDASPTSFSTWPTADASGGSVLWLGGSGKKGASHRCNPS